MLWWRQREVDALVAEYGAMPPPWAVYDEHPSDGFWRQGGGESLKLLWSGWWERQGFGEGERLAYFRQWPVPPRWLPFLIEAVWGVWALADRAAAAPYFERTAALGFGGRAEFDRDWNDPRWLRRERPGTT